MPVRPSQRAQGRAGRRRARAQDQSRARPAAAQACVAALLTFGLEFEGSLPDGPREGLAAVAAKLMLQGFAAELAGQSGRNYGVVQIKPDSSISASFRSSASNPVALEVVTPVLTLANGLDFLRRLLGAISASVFFGGMKVNRSCGTHLHLGTAEWLLSKTKVFIVNFTFYQEVFAALSPPSRRTSNFCKRMPCHESFVQALLRCTSVAEIKELFGFDRYFRLNVQRLGEASPTLEVRLGGATHSFNKVKHWIALFLRCCLSTGSQPWPRPAPSAPPAELLRSLYLQLTAPLPEPWQGHGTLSWASRRMRELN